MVLSHDDIECRCRSDKLLEDYCEENIQTCSYDLRMGNQYYFDMNEGGENVEIGCLNRGDVLKIPPDAICYVITKETVNMPDDLTASISLPLKLIKEGVMLAAQPPYDPGYRGKTVALLHNLSNEPVKIEYEEHVLNIVFTKLSYPVSADQQYKGDYQELNDLKYFCKEVKVGAVFELKQELMKRKERFENFMPNLVMALTVIMTVMTILVTVMLAEPTITGLFGNRSTDVEEEAVANYDVSVNEDGSILTIYIDGQYYNIDIQK